MLGFPVDAISGAISGAGELTGLWGPIENPVGGSASISGLLEPFRAGIPEPQTDTERFARRVGEELGAGAAGAPVALMSTAGRSAPVAAALVELASSLGSGAGAAVANQVAPGSMVAEIAGQLAGGLPATVLSSRALGLGGTDAVTSGGTVEAQKQRAADAYGTVRADQTLYSVDPLVNDVNAVAQSERLNRRLQPVSANVQRAVNDDFGVPRGGMGPGAPQRIEDIENMRRVMGGSVSPTTAPADQRITGLMRDEITSYLDSIDSPTTDALREGRDATRRYKAAEAILEAESKAGRRAASTGSGGNEINAMRQNLRSILDNPAKRRSFTPDELAQIESVVVGNTEQNAMRRLSRFAPSSGGLASMLGIGGAMASAPVALPIIAATEGAKALGERSTRRSIDALVRSLLDERITAVGSSGQSPVAAALLGSRVLSEDIE